MNLPEQGRALRQIGMRRLIRISQKLGLVCLSLLLTLALLEGVVRLLGYSAIYEVYSKPDLLWQHDELLGWSQTPNSTDIFVGPRPFPVEFRTPIRINSDGLRGDEILELPPDGYRILVLGDSGVAAFEVADDETFVAVLERRLNDAAPFPIQVINAGVRGYGTDQSYLYYLERGRRLQPDLVLFFHSPNDPEDNMTLHRMRRPFGKAAFALRSDGSLERLGYPIPKFDLCSAWRLNDRYEPERVDEAVTRILCRFQSGLADHVALLSVVSTILQNYPGLLHFLKDLSRADARSWLGVRTAHAAAPADPRPDSALTSALLRDLAAEVQRSGARFQLWITWGEQVKLDWKLLGPIDYDIRQPKTVQRTPFFRRKDARFRNDPHRNALGHELQARSMLPAVIEQIRIDRPDGAGWKGGPLM